VERTILHCDLNGFYASVECALNPKLKDVPMAVGGNVENRHGIILAKNELAKKFNVKTAEAIWQAKKKCPNLIIVPPSHDLYAKYSKLANKIYQDYTDLVEPFGIDESWLDVTGSYALFGDGKTIADKIRNRIKEELNLTISVGVSYNKIFAKLGSDYKKPDATTVIDKNNYKEIAYPLAVGDLFYVGGETVKKLNSIGIKTIGQLACSDKNMLIKTLGKMGGIIYYYANGIDNSPVKSAYDKTDLKSIGNGITFKRNLVTMDDIKIGVITLSDEIAMRMRKHGQKCTVIAVTIRDDKFATIQRQKTLEEPTYLAKEIMNIAMELIKTNWNISKPIRMLTITGKNLVKDNFQNQINIFENNRNSEKQEKLEKAIFELRHKFGEDSLHFGTTVKTDILPDDN